MAEHEGDILLYKAEKQAYEELGYGKDKKLPTIKKPVSRVCCTAGEKKPTESTGRLVNP